MLSGAKILRPNKTYSLEFIWITAKYFYKQHIRKFLCPTEMLWVELIMIFQPKRNIKQTKKGKVKYEIFSGGEEPRPFITYLHESS